MKIYLAGNPNCGKSTLFNALTGGRVHTGNYPGVTVAVSEGKLLPRFGGGADGPVLTDLPGTYALRPFSPEEKIACDLLAAGADCVISVIDATAPVRGTALLIALRERGLSVVAALNLTDALTARGGSCDAGAFGAFLGVPAVAVSARSGEGLETLAAAALRAAEENKVGRKTASAAAPGGGCAACGAVACPMCADGENCRNAPEWRTGGGTKAKNERIYHPSGVKVHQVVPDASDAAAEDTARRFALAERAVAAAFVLPEEPEPPGARRADDLLLGRWTALPLLALLTGTVMFLTFVFPGRYLSELLTGAAARGAELLSVRLSAHGLPPLAVSLLCNGVIGGVGGVIGFLPVVMTLYFCLAMLEDSGYLARAVFISDRRMRAAGLSGRSLIPLLTGFGCSVPAFLSTRTAADARERRRAALLIPFMSCSAKLPVYSMFCAAFFPCRAGLVCAGLYGGGVLIALLLARLITGAEGGEATALCLLPELPDYRLPTLRGIARKIGGHAADFLRRAFGIILCASLAVWGLSGFTPAFRPALRPEDSLLYAVGAILAPVFWPLGFASPAAVAALVAGLCAKESILSTFGVLSGGAGGPEMFFTRASALSFLVFVLLYSPCAAALAAVRREFGTRRMLLCAGLNTAAAWLCAALTYRAACLLGI